MGEFNDDLLNDSDFLAKCHHALLEIHVVDGNLICPESKRKFPIKDGIPNMLLRGDELPNVKVDELRDFHSKKKKNDKQNECDDNETKKETVDDSKTNTNNSMDT